MHKCFIGNIVEVKQCAVWIAGCQADDCELSRFLTFTGEGYCQHRNNRQENN